LIERHKLFRDRIGIDNSYTSLCKELTHSRFARADPTGQTDQEGH
jgi:hypothetical protein